jgi:hypothetical protein
MNHRSFDAEEFFSLSMWVCSFLLLLWLMTLGGCASQPMPKVDVSFWAGDSVNSGISRSQEKKTIACSAPEIDQYACLTYLDIKKIFSAMLQCQKWGGPIATEQDVNNLLSKNHEVIQKALSQKK